MKTTSILRILFWCLAAMVLFLALTSGPLGEIIPSDVERHYLAFLVMPIFAAYVWPSVPLPAMWAAFVAFGGLIEFLQKVMNIGRAAEWHDWVNDIVATTIALVIANVIVRRRGANETA